MSHAAEVAASSSSASTTLVSSCDEAGPSSGAPLRRQAQSSLQPIDTLGQGSRSRARSIGRSDVPASANDALLSPLPLHLHDMDRGPGTPDFTLGNPMRPARVARTQSSSAADAFSKASGSRSTKAEAPSPPRPRLSGLRSFFGSFTGTSADATAVEASASAQGSSSSKLRSSSDFEEDAIVGGASASDRFQGLSASAVALDSSSAPRRPLQVLAMPAARPAGPEGLRGLNDDSPPLTPTSEDQSAEEGSSSSQRQPYHAPRHAWSQAQAAADASARNATFTPSVSSAASGRASPVFSTFSDSSNGTFSPPTRPGSSIPPSGFKVTPSAGLLPSHLISPPATPPPGQRSASLTAPIAEMLSLSPAAALRAMQRRAQRAVHAVRAAKLPPLRPHLPALMALLMVFVASTMCIVLGLSTLPIVMPKHLTSLTLDEIREACMSLRNYSRSSNKAGLHTLAVLSAFFTWKQAFTVPGSLIMNVVFGAMYGTVWATIYTSVLTSLGGVCCYLLVKPLAPLLVGLPGLSKPLAAMRRALAPSAASTRGGNPLARPGSAASRRRSLAERRSAQRHRRSSTIVKIAAAEAAGSSNVWSYLLVLRVLPVVPYGLMNIACGVLKVPLLPFAGTLALGSVPWNAITAQVGELLLEVVQALPGVVAAGTLADGLDEGGFSDAAAPGSEGLTRPQRLHLVANKAQGGARAIAAHIWKPEMLAKLVLLSLVSLAPMLLQRYLKHRQAKLDAAAEAANDAELDEVLEFEHEADSDIEMDAQQNEEDEADTSFATECGGKETRGAHRSSWAPERLRSAWAWDDSASGLGRTASLGGRASATAAFGQRYTHERQNTDAGECFAKPASPVFDFDDASYEDAANDDDADEQEDINPYDAIIKLENESSSARRSTVAAAA